MLTGGFSRVSSSMMTNTFIRDIQRNLTSVAKLQHQISTGKRIEYPSDDPIGADRALDYKQILAQAQQYSRNIDDADSTAQNIDQSLGQMEDLLFRIRDLAVTGANEAPENQRGRDAIAAEVDTLLAELVHEANQKFDGKFLFGGAKNNVTPFTAKKEIEFTWTQGTVTAGDTLTFDMPKYTIDGATLSPQAITDDDSIKAILINGRNLMTDPALGGSYSVDPATNQVTINLPGTATIDINDTDTIELVFDKIVAVKYNGDMGTREIEVGENNRMQVSYAGAVSTDSAQMSVFGKYSADGAETATVEAFQHLMDLRDALYKYDRLWNENPVGSNNSIQFIQKGIEDVEKIRNNITNVRAKQGGIVNRMDLAKNRLETLKINTTELLSKREDVDMAEAISQLVLMQNVYQSALGAGSMIIQTTLLDFLR